MSVDGPFNGFFRGKKVLITGHTGFKGSWLALWLIELGADVTGFSLDPPTEPNLFKESGLKKQIKDVRGDIRDLVALKKAFSESQPEIVFHLAAQPIVRTSYDDPITTYTSNAIGTLNVLEAVRRTPSVAAAIMITTDKVYRNEETFYGFREFDPLGGHDPYSASKACAEIIIESHRKSFFAGKRVASVRAGNVISGGDWAKDRIIPDLVRAFAEGKSLEMRNPSAMRPWQHVLEPLSGYLWLAAQMVTGKAEAGAWNFGPAEEDAIPVERIVKKAIDAWGGGSYSVAKDAAAVHEAAFLKLDCSKAHALLHWHSIYGVDDAVSKTIGWYKAHLNGMNVWALTLKQIADYTAYARAKGLAWAGR